MAEVLKSWLADAGVEANNLEQDFANGWLFGKLLHAFNMQPDVEQFVNKGKPDAYLNNYTRLQPTFTKLGVRMDTRTAQALINKEAGLAARVLYSIKQALNAMNKDLQTLNHAGKTIQKFGVRSSPSRGMLEAQHHITQHAAYQSGNLKFFEDVMRKRAESPNKLMESLHLKRFADEGSRQADAAAEAAVVESSMKQAQIAARRNAELGKLSAARTDKSIKLQRDEAVHAALLKHQDDVERQELRVEMAMSELSKHRQQEARAAAASDAAAGIDAFEMTLKRLGGESSGGGNDDLADAPATGECPMATLGRIRAYASTAAKLADSGGEYLASIKARREEEVAARKEREARRRKLLAEQQAARSAAEGRLEAESLLEVLVRRSGEEQKLGQRLWQLRQEKAAMEADRKLREQQYAVRREKDWEETIRREIELHRSMKSQFEASTQQELATWKEQQHQHSAAKAAKHQALAQEVTWQLVQLAERAIEYRAATAGQAVPRRDWKAWTSLFLAGDPSLGAPVVSANPTAIAEPESARLVMNTAELQDYLACRGEWTLAEAVGNNSCMHGKQQHAALGRVVAELAALTQKLHKHQEPVVDQTGDSSKSAVVTAAEAVAAEVSADTTVASLQTMPLKLAVVGGPFSGKTTIARGLSQKYGIKLLTPEQLVTNAVAAAHAWRHKQENGQQQIDPVAGQDQQQPQAETADTAAASDVPMQVQLGQRALQELQQGGAVSDGLLVELLVEAMLQAKDYIPVPPEPPAETKGQKGGKNAAKSDTASSNSTKGQSSTGSVAANSSTAAPGGSTGKGRESDTATAAAAAQGRGFVIDGFPATAQQAVLLEKALTGLDLAAEQSLVDGASLVAPPPLDVLPQLQRPLVSGLDAVLVLTCADEAVALKRALGRRLDPTTGRIYHLEFDPPPANVPGLSERLVMVSGPDNDTVQVPQRLANYTATAGPLSEWLSRFSTLRRPLDGAAELGEVLTEASDVASGILVAKKAAQAAKVAAEAAHRARESAEKAKDYARVAQCHAEAAARELLTAKRAEIQAAALLNGGKNPDPASTEVLKAQAATKCAEQLKVCRIAATDAAGHADRAKNAAESAAGAVQRCKLAVGDAAVSADAEAMANKAAVDAEAAANAAVEAAKKAEAAKQLSEAYVAEAEKWFAATEVQPDAAIPSAQQLAAATAAQEAADAPADSADAESIGTTGGSSSNTALFDANSGKSKALSSPAGLPAAVVPLLHDEWRLLEQVYIDGMGRGFAGLRDARNIALSHVAGNCEWFSQFLKRADGKQALLQSFVEKFNAVELDMRKAKEAQGELLLRCEELRDGLWSVCDAKHEEAESARLKLAGDGSSAEHISLLGQHLTNLAQVELDRFLATAQFLYSYCHYAQGIYSPPGADKPLCPQPTVLANVAPEPSKPDPPAKGGAAAAAAAAQQPSYLHSLQQRLPQLAAALKAATAAANATQSTSVALVDEASKKVAAAAASAAAAATAAATAAAAAAAGQGAAGAHKAAAGAGAKSAAGAAAGAAAGGKAAAATAAGKQAVSAEEAAAAAAATAAAAAAAVAAMPTPTALAAVAADLQTALAQEVQLLQQRLVLLGTKAAVIVDEVVQLQAAANCKLAEWQQKRYVAEYGAVAALEKIVKAAAASGQPLPHDLRLEDEFLIVDESQLLVPPAATAPPPRPTTPQPPPGVLAVQQLQQLADALQQAAPAGFLPVTAGVELLLLAANQGMLPSSWLDVDAAHMTAALSHFDPTYSGYLDWRELLLAFAAASIPVVHTATAAQIAAQAVQLSAADSDADGCLTQQEFESVSWWFEPRAEVLQELMDHQQEQPEAAAEIMREVARCKSFKQLLWALFQQSPVAMEASSTSRPATDGQAAPQLGTSRPATAAATAEAPVSAPATSASPQSPQLDSAAAGGDAAPGTETSARADKQQPLCNTTAMLLYLCPDRDLYQGISKAVAAVTKSAAAGTTITAPGVVQMCYPLLTPEQATPIQRAPLTAAQIAAAVSAAVMVGDGQFPTLTGAAGQQVSVNAATGSATAQTGGKAGAATAAAEAAAAAAAAVAAAEPAAVKASQLMYSAACERVVTLLLHRYQWKDVYIAARV